MAEPVWAMVVAGLGLLDMGANYCATGCLAPRTEVPALAVSAGPVIFGDEAVATEFYLRRDTARAFGPFRIGLGMSMNTRGALWAGAGIIHRIEFPGSPAYLESHFMPGFYLRGNGADLGGPINARAGVELGWTTQAGIRVGLSVDHRSHGGIFDRNPGVETVQLRLTVPTR